MKTGISFVIPVVKKEEELINGREVRASNISFMGEKVMQEENAFTIEYLNQVLTGQALTTSNKYF